MKRFQFALEGLMRVRRIEEERKLVAMQQVRTALAAIDSDLRAIADEHGVQVDGIRALMDRGILSEELLTRRRYLNLLNRRRVERERERAEMERALGDAQRALEAAARARQVVERLKERRRAEHAAELARAETKELDEHGRRSFHVAAAERGGDA